VRALTEDLDARTDIGVSWTTAAVAAGADAGDAGRSHRDHRPFDPIPGCRVPGFPDVLMRRNATIMSVIDHRFNDNFITTSSTRCSAATRSQPLIVDERIQKGAHDHA
jgi:hypothetical protein